MRMPGWQLLTIANLVPRKRIDLCVGAGKRLASEGNLTWTIVGKGPLEQNLNLAQYPFVRWIQRVPSLVEEYDKATVFVLPSEGEGFGMVYIESILCGCPAICRAGGAGEEIIRATGGGIAVDLSSETAAVERLTEAIRKIAQTRNDYMNVDVLKRALQFADRDRLRQRWLGMFEMLIK